ncbi:MAG: hypothetical protein KAS93_02965 [Gammaproteobacteria bacterium]|nr:hypothetical protein [Gammaproteobacteria bacterium]
MKKLMLGMLVALSLVCVSSYGNTFNVIAFSKAPPAPKSKMFATKKNSPQWQSYSFRVKLNTAAKPLAKYWVDGKNHSFSFSYPGFRPIVYPMINADSAEKIATYFGVSSRKVLTKDEALKAVFSKLALSVDGVLVSGDGYADGLFVVVKQVN